MVGSDLFHVAVAVMSGSSAAVASCSRCRRRRRRTSWRSGAAHLEETHPAVDVLVYDGGQERYPLLFGVE